MYYLKKLPFLLLAAIIFVGLAQLKFSELFDASAAEGIRQTIHFQGKVVNDDGTNVADGAYNFEFKIYTVATVGTEIWTETRTGGNQVTVTDGVFRVELGSVTALPGSVDFNTDNIYLSVNFNGDGEMSPRIRFTAVPYAFNALTVSGLTVTSTTGTLTIPDATTIAFSGANDVTFTSSGATSVTLPTTGTLSTLAGAETLTNKIIGTTGLTFTGAATDITTGANEDLVITANGTGNIGLGTASPGTDVDITGDVWISGGLSLYSTSVTDGTVEATRFCTGEGESNCVTDFSTLGGGVFSDGGTYVYPTDGEGLGNSTSDGANKIANLFLGDDAGITFGATNDASLLYDETTDNRLELVASGFDIDLSGAFTFDSASTATLGSTRFIVQSDAAAGNTTTEAISLKSTANLGSSDELFQVGDSGGDFLTILGNGFVGIGTADPGQALEVSGSVEASTSVLSPAFDTASAGTLSIGNSTATSVSICNSAACDTITIGTNGDADTITIGDVSDSFTLASSGLNISSAGAIQGATTFSSSGDWTWTATTPTITINSAETFTVTDGSDVFAVNTSASSVSFANGGNGFTWDIDSGPLYTGTARPARKIVLSPEYSGATLTTFYGAGTESSSVGSMTADVETTAADGLRTFYEWTSAEGSSQSYTVALRVQLPPDFSGWATSNALQISFTTESTSTASNALSAYVYLSSDSTTAVASDVTNAAAVAETWETITIDDSVLDDGAAPEWDAAGETAIIYLRMISNNNNFVRIGDVELNYLASY